MPLLAGQSHCRVCGAVDKYPAESFYESPTWTVAYPELSILAAVAVSAALLLALAAEGVVRFRAYLTHGVPSVEFLYRIDPTTKLRTPVPGLRTGSIEISSLGFRSPEIPIEKPSGTLRIAFLGASTTFCAEVSAPSNAWPDIVARELAKSWQMPVDYVNAGVPGMDIEAIGHTFTARVSQLRPDIVLLYEATNDLTSDTYELARARRLSFSAPQDRNGWLIRHSVLWDLAQKNWRILLPPDDDKLELNAAEWAVLAERYEHRVTALVRRIQATGATAVLATFSYDPRREHSEGRARAASNTALYYMPYLSVDGLLTGYETYNTAIRRAARATGALLIEDEYAIPGDSAQFVDSVHFSDRGSARMAERVTAVLAHAPVTPNG